MPFIAFSVGTIKRNLQCLNIKYTVSALKKSIFFIGRLIDSSIDN